MEIRYFDTAIEKPICKVHNELTVPRIGEAIVIEDIIYEVVNVYYHYRRITLGESVRYERSHEVVILSKLGKDVIKICRK